MSIDWIWARSHMVKFFCEVNEVRFERPPLPTGAWNRIDEVLEEAVQSALVRADLEVVLVLTNETAEETSRLVAVWFEPTVDVVIALNPGEQRASVSYTDDLWPALKTNFERVQARASEMLGQSRLDEALLRIAGEIDEFPPVERTVRPLRFEPPARHPDAAGSEDAGPDPEMPATTPRGWKRLLAWFRRRSRANEVRRRGR